MAQQQIDYKQIEGYEEGYNSNGNYVKLPDGTLICYCAESAVITTSEASGGVFSSPQVTFTFPHPFSVAPRNITTTTRWNNGRPFPGLTDTASTTGVSVRVMGTTSTSRCFVSLTVIGRWK